jgi:hypothetical protein
MSRVNSAGASPTARLIVAWVPARRDLRRRQLQAVLDTEELFAIFRAANTGKMPRATIHASNSSRSSLVSDEIPELSALMIASAKPFFFACNSSTFCSTVSADQTGGEDRLLLADAMGAIDRLGFDRRVPPGVEQIDGAGGGEIQADAPGFEADQEDRRAGAGLELIDQFLAVFGFAVEIEEVDVRLLQTQSSRSRATR